MISVGIRELKNQLSQYLQYVKRGDTVLITEHNKVIAKITLPKDEELEQNKLSVYFDQLAEAGKLIKAQRSKSLASQNQSNSSVDWISVYRDNRET